MTRKKLFNLQLASCALLSGQVVGVAAPWSSDVAVEIFGEEFLSENVLDVREQVALLSDHEAFALLSDWGLPGALHLSFRLGGEFTPVDVAGTGFSEVDRSGWTLVSPVIELLDVAVRTGRLQELRDRVALIPTAEGMSHGSPEWSPDGDLIAFDAGRTHRTRSRSNRTGQG